MDATITLDETELKSAVAMYLRDKCNGPIDQAKITFQVSTARDMRGESMGHTVKASIRVSL